ncbi:MAG: methyltransferase domain-containing protein [Saprospiraceae bacterium]|jgi:SAM-dependent methyltransferase|uniref:class I SAM-dependent methyltransferase n=1 Tax=Candidatus Brachybacter algidus TaxID=2982024 RepID=UPI001B503423|nr:class I SAM-dependent methyltransferase [Candidatus Brachybacter algidus]MBP7305491.1 methyltransferase domain-containing protein [Saprospiraceae bacterium]MBK6372570.1 methyltransferase domain-containing protein [Candidatus Brachybacter algidus]MBK6448452.1 methyltransferase domain-containing protein [Candidatus Brachybacter algidus]MBK7603945.1 methyltransferase domain-containing protein [Candidatus Brachybacter algidus]MBK8354062.1 methyltransferase domain-containing protein [Candidatus 
MPRNIFVIVGLCVWFGLFSACKQEVKEIPQDITRPDTDTNINPKEFDQSDNEPDRVIWQKPEMVMELLGDMKDKVVADIGAGTGFFTFRLLQQAKKVIAVDIDKGPLERMRMLSQKLDTSISNKLEIKLAKPSDPELQPQSVDIVFLSNTYMYIQDRTTYLRNLKKYLRPKARILIIDYKRKVIPFGPPYEERVGLNRAERELKEAGYTIERSDDVSLDYQYILLAKYK